jgi:hypothetical protein
MPVDWGPHPTHLAIQWTQRTVCGLKTDQREAWPYIDSRWVHEKRELGMRFCPACTGQPEPDMPGQMEMW